MAKNASAQLLNALANAYETAVGTSPRLRLYTGSKPAATTDAATGTLLAEAVLPSDWLSDASGGVKGLLGTWSDSLNDASGPAGYYRLVDSAGTTTHEQGTVGLSGSGADLILSDTAIVANGSFTVTSWNRTATIS